MGSNVGTARLLRNASLGLLVAGTAGATVASASAQAHAGAGNSRALPGTESWSTQPTDVHKATEQALQRIARAGSTTPAAGAMHATVATRTPVVKATAPRGAVPRTYTVRPGDTLASIAESQLGHESLWPEIFALNRGSAQPDGGQLTDPNLLQPGWALDLAVGDTHPVVPLRPTTISSHAPAAHTTTPVRPAEKTGTASLSTPASTSSSRTTASDRTKASTASGGSPRTIAESIVPSGQFGCFSEIISHESGWDVHAENPSSGAYGLPQALPGSKMASAGSDWRDDAATQIRWALSYMDSRYGSPCDAWNFWQDHRWY